MAECEKYQALCEASLERTLTAEEQQRLDGHLAVCSECAAYLADLRFLTEGLAAETLELPAGLHERIMAGLRTEQPTARTARPLRWQRLALPALGAAACVLLVLSGTAERVLSGAPKDAGASMAAVTAETAEMPAEAPASGAVYAAEDAGVPAEAASYEAEAAVYDGAEPDSEENGMPAARRMPTEVRHSLGFAESAEDAAATDDLGVAQVVMRMRGGERFAFFYLVENAPELSDSFGELLYRDEQMSCYAVENNLSQLEQVIDTLDKAGYPVSRYEEVGLLPDESAARGLFIVRIQ